MTNAADRWFKLFWIRLRDSRVVQSMKDFQKWWYLALIAESVYSERPGYIPNDPSSLYRLSGCTASREFFQRNSDVVVGAFRVDESGTWLYHPRAKQLAEEMNNNGKSYTPDPEEDLFFTSLSYSGFSNEEINKAIERLFVFYQALFQKDGRYKLTAARKTKCRSRLTEYMTDNKCELGIAEEAAREAMRHLRESPFHMGENTNGTAYHDWIDHIFKSREMFEKRLAMRVGEHGAGTKQQANADAIERAAREVAGADV